MFETSHDWIVDRTGIHERHVGGTTAGLSIESGRKALDMLSLADPALDWVSLARGMGVPGVAATTAEEFTRAVRDGLAERGPFLIEAII